MRPSRELKSVPWRPGRFPSSRSFVVAESKTNPVPGDDPILTENALRVLQSRYLIKDLRGTCIETPAQLFSRVASLIAEAEGKYGASGSEIRQWHKRYYDVMASLRFLPNSPTLMNARRRGMLSACFVLPIEDSIEGIFEAIKETALIQQAGGGTGFSFDRLRPTGDRVASSGGTTCGRVDPHKRTEHHRCQSSNHHRSGHLDPLTVLLRPRCCSRLLFAADH